VAVGFPNVTVSGRSDTVLPVHPTVPFHTEGEYAVPAELAVQVTKDIDAFMWTLPFANNFIVEVRFVRADNIWLSNSFGRDSCQITVGRFWPAGDELDQLLK
jgi:hypothetical protein